MIPLALAFLLGATLQDDAVELRWKYEKGQELRYRTTQKVSSDVNGTPVRQQMSTTMALEVKEVDEKGVVTILVRYEAVAARASGVQEYDYDSEKDKEPPDDPPTRMMSKLVGQVFTMKTGPDGKVLEVRGYEKLVEAMSKAFGEDEAARERAKQALKQMFSDEACQSRMQQLAPPLPAGKVRKGDGWSSDFSIRLPFVDCVTYKIRSKLADVKDGNALVDQEIAVEFKGSDDKENPVAGQVEVREAKGKASGVFSIARGRFLSHQAAVDMVLVVGKSTVPVRVETELKLLEKK
jgi:uncharacterized protein DUF6263